MGDLVPVALGRGSKKSAFGLEGVAEFVNCYLEEHGDGSKTGSAVYAINGDEQFSTLPDGAGVRAMLDLGSTLLAVAARSLYAIGPNGSASRIGSIPADGFVSMARNQQAPNPQVAIVCNGAWYTYQLGVGVLANPDGDLPPVIDVVAKDSYFVFLCRDGRWFLAGPNDTEVDPLLFATAENQPDNLVRGTVRGPDLLLFGDKSTEAWHNTGAADFPFERVTTINVGCYAAGSVQKTVARVNNRLVDTVIFAATDHEGAFAGVYILDGYTPVKVSTAEVDRLVTGEGGGTHIVSQSWTEESVNGQTHTFYAITGADFTMVLDTVTGDWHARKSDGLERWRYSCHAVFMGRHVWGDYEADKLYRSSPSLRTAHGEPIKYSITMPTIHMGPHRFRVNALHVDALTGVGAASETDADASPVLLMDYSRDGGKSFGATRQCALGASGQRHVRIKERAFGIFDHNGFAPRYRCSAAVLKGIQGVHIDADKLSA